MIQFLFLFSLLLLLSASHAADFCVADLNAARTFSGYACKNASSVTTDDFVFTKLGIPGNTSNSMKASAAPVFVQQFPALNGLGLAMARADLAPGGFIPIHTHPAATEIIYIQSGSVTAGFFSTANVAYVKKLNQGDVMIFPQGLYHFQVNTGSVPATIIVSFSNPEPGILGLANSLFSNDISSQLLALTTLLDVAEVKRLKGMFNGTG